ncbi:MAG TPA: hypothetical protein PLQ93_12495 [Bacteroidia bacterium]|nr:hypothetical protein [Bacteroidia bacterium]
MIRTLAGLQIRNRLKVSKAFQGRHFPEWQSIKSIGLIIEDKEGVSREKLDRFIQSLDKFVEVYFLELKSRKASYADWICFDRSSRNVLGLPVKRHIQPIKKKHHDLVINTVTGSVAFAAALCAEIESACVCTCSDEYGHGDMIIQRQTNQDLLGYLNQVTHYLKLIKTKV